MAWYHSNILKPKRLASQWIALPSQRLSCAVKCNFENIIIDTENYFLSRGIHLSKYFAEQASMNESEWANGAASARQCRQRCEARQTTPSWKLPQPEPQRMTRLKQHIMQAKTKCLSSECCIHASIEAATACLIPPHPKIRSSVCPIWALV